MAKRDLTIYLRAKNAMASGIASAQKALSSFGKSITKITGFFLKWGTVAVTAIATVGGVLIRAGANAQEMRSKFEAVFKGLSKGAEEYAADLADTVGRSKYDLMGFMSSLQDIFVPMGIGRDEAAKLSKELTKLAVDVASFNNVSDAKVLEDFKAAMTGSNEVLKKYGVVITEAKIKEEAYALGLAESGKQVSEAAKVQARYSLLLKGTTDAQGDAERTADSFTNQWKRLQAQVKDATTEIGESIIKSSALSGTLKMVGDAVEKAKDRISSFLEQGGMVDVIHGFKNFASEAIYRFKSVGLGAKLAWSVISDGAETAVNYLWGAFKSWFDWNIETWKYLGNYAKAAWEKIRHPTSRFDPPSTKPLTDAFDAMVDAAKGKGAVTIDRTKKTLREIESLNVAHINKLEQLEKDHLAAKEDYAKKKAEAEEAALEAERLASEQAEKDKIKAARKAAEEKAAEAKEAKRKAEEQKAALADVGLQVDESNAKPEAEPMHRRHRPLTLSERAKIRIASGAVGQLAERSNERMLSLWGRTKTAHDRASARAERVAAAQMSKRQADQAAMAKNAADNNIGNNVQFIRDKLEESLKPA